MSLASLELSQLNPSKWGNEIYSLESRIISMKTHDWCKWNVHVLNKSFMTDLRNVGLMLSLVLIGKPIF